MDSGGMDDLSDGVNKLTEFSAVLSRQPGHWTRMYDVWRISSASAMIA